MRHDCLFLMIPEDLDLFDVSTEKIKCNVAALTAGKLVKSIQCNSCVITGIRDLTKF
jgi:hypothetical protein